MDIEQQLKQAKENVFAYIEQLHLEYKYKKVNRINKDFCRRKYDALNRLKDRAYIHCFPLVFVKEIMRMVIITNTCKNQCFECMADVGQAIKLTKSKELI